AARQRRVRPGVRRPPAEARDPAAAGEPAGATDPRGRVHQRRRDQGRRRRWRAGVPNGGVSGTRGGGNTPPARGPVGAASAAIVESAKTRSKSIAAEAAPT